VRLEGGFEIQICCRACVTLSSRIWEMPFMKVYPEHHWQLGRETLEPHHVG